MGNPEKLRAVRGMWKRWLQDEHRLHALFGEYTEHDYSEDAEMQRNLGTAIFHAGAFIKRFGKG